MDLGRRGIVARAAGLVAFTALVLGLSSWGSRERLPQVPDAQRMTAIGDYIGCLEHIAVLLGDVVDDDSAAAAAPVIRGLARRMVVLRRQIGRLADSEREPIGVRYGGRLATASERLGSETRRIGEEPHLARALQVALVSVPPLI